MYAPLPIHATLNDLTEKTLPGSGCDAGSLCVLITNRIISFELIIGTVFVTIQKKSVFEVPLNLG